VALSPQFLKDLRVQAERPFGTRPENPETIVVLLDEIDRLNKEIERLRRSIG
jgi:hypothetical protein